MNYNLTPEQLKEIENRTGTSDLSRTQFNIKLPSGQIIPAGINPGSAATIQLGGGVMDRSTTEGQQIASQFPAQTVNPQQAYQQAVAQTPVQGGAQPMGQPFGQFTTASSQPTQTTQPAPQQGKPFGNFTYGPETPNQDLSQQLNQMMTTLQGMQQQTGGQASGYTGPSIVDYLASVGKPSDFTTRQKLAQQMGIQNYTGTAEQNTQLLNAMRGQQQQPVSPAQPTQPPAQAITASADTKVQNSLQGIMTGDPTKSLTDIVKELSTSMGLTDITNQIQELDNKMTQEIADINLNPWDSDALRSKKTALTQQKYESRKNALIDRLKLQNDVVKQAVDYYQAEREYQKDMMKIQLDQAQREIQNKLEQAKIESAAKISGLTPAQINSTVNSIAGAFDSEPVVKEYNTMKTWVSAFDTYGTSPTDDQARIYAFAKVMDPNSVVRESEYNTVQEYSQALLKKAGINLARIFTDQGALSQSARDAMSKTLKTRLNSQEVAYNNIRNEYQRQIDDAYAGKTRTITQYTPVTQEISSEQATNELNKIISGGYKSGETPSLSDNPEGFFDGFLNMFGLKTK